MTTPPTTLTLAALDSRLSVPTRQLAAPGPDHDALLRILRSAVRVPDHGKRMPFRFVRIAGDARVVLADAAVEKDRLRFSWAPVIVAVISRPTVPHKVPEIEQTLSGGAVCFALLQAAQALGFGAQWLTGWPAYDDRVRARLGLADGERILGFIHIGTAHEPAPERVRPDPATLLTELRP
jgi:nitroreductase